MEAKEVEETRIESDLIGTRENLQVPCMVFKRLEA